MGIDCTFVVETMSRLSNSMSKFLGDASKHCTPSEMFYYDTVHLLATLISLCVSIDRSAPLPDVFGQMADAVQASMAGQLDGLPSPAESTEKMVSTFRSLHQITMLHDTAMATKLATAWILTFNEREKERDRSGSSNLPKDVVVQAKSLQACAESALKEGKAVMSWLKKEVGNGADLGRSLRSWAFEDGGSKELNELVEDGTVKELVESWRLNAVGWGHVKWE